MLIFTFWMLRNGSKAAFNWPNPIGQTPQVTDLIKP
jgi:hypothetical protein